MLRGWIEDVIGRLAQLGSHARSRDARNLGALQKPKSRRPIIKAAGISDE